MTKNIEVEHLVINKLTQEQFDNIEEKNPTELYFVTDAETLPDQAGNAGKFLTTDGENVSWVNVDAVTQTALDLKADKSSVYDKTEVGDLLKTKQDTLEAGDGIEIKDGVISNTNVSAEWGKVEGTLSNQTDLQSALDLKANQSTTYTKTEVSTLLDTKQDILTPGSNIIIVDNVISSTAQESFFRERFAEWTSVPTSSENYTADFHGNTTPSYNDYIVVEDASLYIPQDFLSDPNNVMIRNLHSAGVNYTIEVVIQDQIRRVYYQECTGGVYAQINDWLSVTYVGGAPGVWYIKTNKEFYINNVFTPTANKLKLLKTDTPYETNFYLSEKPGVAPLPIYGSWRFVYHGVWADDNILGWKPEYQIEETLPIADDTQAGIAKLYKTSGSNTDGAMTQQAVGSAISTHNTATNAHSNIRGVAGGLATLDNNAKVPMAQINDALLGNVSYQGLWNAAENVPFLADPSGDIQLPKGHYYITSVAGDRFGLHFDVGDWIISSGGYWSKVDNTDAVSAVNGMTGNVVLNANDVNAYNKTEIDDKFAEVNTQINANTEAIADAKDDINDLQTQINTRTRVIIRRWN